MGLFDKGKKRQKEYSDEAIDSFVEYLRANDLTIDTEEAAIHFLKLQSNLDPAAAKKKVKLDDRLVPSSNSPMHHLWLEYPDYHKEKEFDPMEFMYENIMNAHKTLEKNFYRINPDSEAFESFDRNQQELAEFLNSINEYSSAVLGMISSRFSITEEDAAAQLEQMKYIAEHPEETGFDSMMNMLLGEGNISSLGGFGSTEELEKLLGDYFAEGGAAAEAQKVTEEPISDSSDAQILVRLSGDKVRAWIYIIPPRKDGSEITEEAIMNALSENGIIYGINTFLVERIKKNHLYFKVLEIARGSDPVNGTNGVVKELFSREENTINLREDKSGKVDYKELGLIKSVHAGDIIAEITLPEPAEDGVQVTGEAVKGVDGKYPDVAVGTNTILSEDRTLLISMMDGELYFSDGKFSVRKVLTIDHDVDASIGNIDFAGDVIIKGNIREGFKVKCEGNLEVYGCSEAAEIQVGGNVTISKGMFGGTTGKIDAGGSLTCRYLEHCFVKVKKDVRTDQILSSTVTAEGTISVSGERGRIIGGNIFAGKGIKAGYIGTAFGASAPTQLTVGMAALYAEQKKWLKKELENVDANIVKLHQNAYYLEKLGDKINSVQKMLLDKLKFQLNVRNFQKKQITANIELMDAQSSEQDESCEIRCSRMKPVVNINFNNIKYTVNKELSDVRVCRINGKSQIRSSDFQKVLE